MAKEREEWVNPDYIRFTHSKIKPIFSDGRTVQGTLQEITSGKLKPQDLPKIVVHKLDEKTYFSMNNRRLWVFKESKRLGVLETVPVRVRPMPVSKRQKNKFTVERCALNAKFMAMKEVAGGEKGEKEEEDESGEED